MRFRRRLPVPIAVLLVAAALVAVVQLRRRAPPEPARLLPGADGFLYVNLKWLRTLKAIGQLPPVPHDPDYERFLEETGFQFERDLDEAAFGVHYPSTWGPGTTGGPVHEPRFSEVFVARFQGDRVREYLRKIASSVDSYHSTDVYNIPIEGRILRIAILNVDTVAASNLDDPKVIRDMIDRSRKLASPFGGPAFLRQYYKALPVVSKSLPVLKLAWFIGRIEPKTDLVGPPGTWSLLFQKPTPVVISAYYAVYSPTLHLRAEAFPGNTADAESLTERMAALVSLFHAAEASVATHGADPDMQAFFDSLRVERQDDRAIITAAVPPGVLRKVVGAPLQEGAEAAETPAQEVSPSSQPQPAGKSGK